MRPTLLAVLALTLAAAPAAAQRHYREPLRPTRFSVGMDAIVSQPVGAFADEVGTGGGLAIHGTYHATPVLSLRAEGNFLVYGHERFRDLCTIDPCRVRFDLETNNQIASAFFGPQLELPAGPLRPYVRAGAGFAYFFTTSSLSGTSGESFASSENYHDGVFAWTGGGGFKAPFTIGQVPVAIDFGARYQRDGEASYLRKGVGLVNNPDGTVRVNPTRSDADFVVWHLGMAVTIPHGQGRHRR